MNAMELPLVLTVSVKLSGSENRALILGQGIACSSTNSPEVAVRGAVAKLLARDGYGEVETELKKITRSNWNELYEVRITPADVAPRPAMTAKQHGAFPKGRW
jgi:hypothetical protein